MQKLKNPTLVILLSSLSALVQSVIVSFVAYKIANEFSFSLALSCFFLAFMVSFIVIYFVYNHFIFTKINKLYLLVKAQQPKEIPNTEIQLEEVDAITRLEEEIQKLAVERYKEVEQTKNIDSYRKEFLGNVSHELKTPIFNIQGYVSTLLDGGIHDDTINVEYLKRADKSIDRMIQIIDDLETITQLEVGSLQLDIEKYDITLQLKDALEALELQASKKGITLQLNKKYDKPIFVLADKFRIKMVLTNLITNSIKYGNENGKTTISLDFYNDQVLVELKDNGIGIDEKHLARLFERFYRVDKGRSREQGGTGLGLAIVKHIIEAHNETINVESKLNKGTSFVFTLKRAE